MPRANRHSIQGQVWHLTHRCHKKQWLLRFKKDRKRWVYWLFKAKQEYGLSVLNYMVTSNHIHLLVQDQGRFEIPKSMQLIAGRTAQEYNTRKERRGAFWEDRYHATAVQTDHHLARCMTYIDLNMVRAGSVTHPDQWRDSGFYELMNPPIRRGCLNTPALMRLFQQPSPESLSSMCRRRVEEMLLTDQLEREAIWTESTMVGDEEFIQAQREHNKRRYPGLKVTVEGTDHMLRESGKRYLNVFDSENGYLSPNNTLISEEILI